MKKSLSLLLALTLVFSLFASMASAAEPPATPGEKYQWLLDEGVLDGDPSGDPNLNGKLTRAQFATVITRIAGIEEATSGQAFTDVLPSQWWYGAIQAAFDAGLVNGTGNGKFSPRADVTLQEVIKVVVTLLELPIVAGTKVEGTSDWAGPYFQAAIDAGLVPASAAGAAKLPTTRGATFNVSFDAFQTLTGPTVVSAKAIDGTTIEVVFSDDAAAQTFTVDALTPGVDQERKVTYKEKEYTVTVKWDVIALDVDSVRGIANTKVAVTLKTATNAVSASQFAIKDSANAAVAISDAKLSADGKTVTLTTAAQTANTLYVLTVGGQDYKFVGQPVDADKPQLVTAVATKNNKVELAFNEELDASTVTNIANYAIDNSLQVLKAEFKADSVTNVILTTSSQSQGTIYKVTVTNVADLAGNIINADNDEATFGGQPKDETKPTLQTAVATGNTTVELTFSEELEKVLAETITNYTIEGLQVLKAELSGVKVTLTTASQTQGTVYKVVVTNVQDEFGNVINSDNDEAQFGGHPKDETKPQVGSAVAKSDTKVEVVFNEKVTKATAETAANYAIEGLTVSAASLADNGTTVTLTTSAQTSGTVYKVVVTNVTDLSGNVVDADHDEFTFGGGSAKTNKPTVSGAVALSATQVRVQFSEVVDPVTAKQAFNYYLGEELGYPTKVVISTGGGFDGGDFYTLTTKTQGTKVYTVDVTGVLDLFGNAVNEDADTATFGGIAAGGDTTAPRVSSAIALNNNTIVVTFNEEIDQTTAETAGNYAFAVQSGSEAGGNSIVGSGANAAKLNSDKKSVTLQFNDANEFTTASVVYKVTVTNVKDAANNVVSPDYNSALFAGVTTANPAPKVTSAVLLNNQTLKITFSEVVSLQAALDTADFTFSPAYAGTVVNAPLASDGKSVTVYFTGATFTPSTIYTVTVDPGKIEDELGLVALASTDNANKSNFAGINSPVSALKVSSIVAVDVNTVDITFNQPITSTLSSATAGDITIVVNAGGGAVASDDVLVRAEGSDGNKLRVFFSANLAAGTVYKITLDTTKVKNLNGTDLAADGNTGIFAAISTANAAPKIASAYAADNNTVVATFSEVITGVDTANDDDFVVTDSAGVALVGATYAITVGSDNKTVTIDLTGVTFTAGTVYKVKLAAGNTIEDEAGVGAADAASEASFVGV